MNNSSSTDSFWRSEIVWDLFFDFVSLSLRLYFQCPCCLFLIWNYNPSFNTILNIEISRTFLWRWYKWRGKKRKAEIVVVAILITAKYHFSPRKKINEIYSYILMCYCLCSFLILFYSGPNRGHYIAIVKSHDFWLLFDDDIVEVSFV